MVKRKEVDDAQKGVRVYALAKELGVPSKDLVTQLKRWGVEATSHMSAIDDEQAERCRKHYKASSGSKQVGGLGAPSTSASVRSEGGAASGQKKSVDTRVGDKKNTVQVGGPVTGEKNQSNTTTSSPRPAATSTARPAASTARPATGQGSGSSSRPGVRRTSYGQRPSFQGRGKSVNGRKRKYERRLRVQQERERVPATEITLTGEMPLVDVANLMGRAPGDLIYQLLKRGMVCNQNHVLTVEVINLLAEEFGVTVLVPEVKKEAQAGKPSSATGKTRAPVVVVMGHVDHGKTSLLDFIRKKDTAAKEVGGITQHLAAYLVDSSHGSIVFLDTPGHEAFSFIRKRGANITDIAILVVDVNSGVQPQTVEAIKHAQDAGVPIVVAINKIDAMRDPAGLDVVKRQLAQHSVVTEDWGGETVCVPISAKTGQGIDELLEMLVLQAELLELKARDDVPARAFILESSLRKGYGPVATVLCVEGALSRGDYFLCGESTGRVRLLLDAAGGHVERVGPSEPIVLVGFEDVSTLGQWLTVVDEETFTKQRRALERGSRNSSGTKGFDFSDGATSGGDGELLSVMIKADTHGSQRALVGELEKLAKSYDLEKDGCSLRVVQVGIGNITENDVEFAESMGATIVGFQVKIGKNASALAKLKKVEIKEYAIIYRFLEDIQKALDSHKKAHITWKKIGEAVVRKVFDIKGAGVIAGCLVRDGVIARGDRVVCKRGGKELGQGIVNSLQQERKNTKEVRAGFECGFTNDTFQDWKEEDTVEVFRQVEQPA